MADYRGPVEILTDDGQHVVSAHSDYVVRVNPRSGMKSWRGVLTRIQPEHTLQTEQYRLKLPNGKEGTVLVNNLRFRSNAPERATFLASGPDPEGT